MLSMLGPVCVEYAGSCMLIRLKPLRASSEAISSSPSTRTCLKQCYTAHTASKQAVLAQIEIMPIQLQNVAWVASEYILEMHKAV